MQVAASAEQRADAEKIFNDLLNDISTLNARTASRSAEIRDLIHRLPPDEQEVHQQQSELATTRARLEQERAQLSDLRRQFQEFISTVNKKIAQQKETVKIAFDQYAEGFLLERCALLWSPQKSRVGQTGELIEYAAFEMDMTGSDFKTPHRRTGPNRYQRVSASLLISHSEWH